jgi:glycosyltransferase involved in cell wall biosynthesis
MPGPDLMSGLATATVHGRADGDGEQPLRVLHLWAGNLFGGVETFLLTLARHRDLSPAMEPYFGLCFTGKLSEELQNCGAPVHVLGPVRWSRPWTVWGARRRLRRFLKEQPFDVVCCHGCWPHTVFAPAVRSAGRPLVFWAHDVPTGRGWVEWWASGTLPDLALANSRLTRSALPHLFAEAPSETLYLPVPAPPLADREAVRRQVRSALQTPEEARVVVQACRLERWKGHTVLVQALAQLRDLPGWVCWIAGGAQRPLEQAYLAELHRSVERLGLQGRVQFLGHQDDVPRLLAAADIHCQPNTGPEPFGIAFIEALHARLPVVTAAIGGALEIVDESCGLLVPPNDPTALAEALRRVIEDRELRATLGDGGPARAMALCGVEKHLAQLEDSLRRLVSHQARR